MLQKHRHLLSLSRMRFFFALFLAVFYANICTATVSIDTPEFLLRFCDATGNVNSFFQKKQAHDHISPDSSCPLWVLYLPDCPVQRISPANAGSFSWEKNTETPCELNLYWGDFEIEQLPHLSVHVSIAANATTTDSRWHIEVHNLAGMCPNTIHFPRLAAIAPQEKEVLAIPYWIGEKTEQARVILADGRRREWAYPGTLSMQCITMYSEGGPGIYLAADDIEARSKSFAAFGDGANGLGLEVCHFSSLDDIEADNYTLDYGVTVGLFEGDWVTVAKRYRHWALQQPWAHDSRLKNGRTPTWAADTGFWVWNRDNSSGVLNPAVQMQDYLNLPVGVFWHWWHGCAYDAGFPEYLPPREGTETFREALRTAQAEDIHAIVYMNQRLWGMTTESWTEQNAERFAVKKRDGSVQPEVYNTFTKTPCASMCMGTPFWRNTYAGLAEEAFKSLGVNGIYMDQACSSLVCYDTTHEHAPGGGAYWMKGFQSLESDIRKRCPGITLAGEGVGEAWLPHLDLMLSLQVSMERYAAPGEWEPIPFFNAVYHGYAIQYGNYASLTRPPYDSLWPAAFAPETPLQLLDEKFCYQFRMEQARSFVWGQQLCLANFTAEQLTKRTAELEYLKRLALLRNQALPWLLHGTFMGFPDMDIPTMKIPMSRLSIYAGQQDAVQEYTKEVPRLFACIWQDENGNIAVPIVNISDEDFEVTLSLNSKEDGLPAKGIAYKILPDERSEIMRFEKGTVTITAVLNGSDACIYEFLNE